MSSSSALSSFDRVCYTNVLLSMIHEYLTIEDIHWWRCVNRSIRLAATAYVRSPMNVHRLPSLLSSLPTRNGYGTHGSNGAVDSKRHVNGNNNSNGHHTNGYNGSMSGAPNLSQRVWRMMRAMGDDATGFDPFVSLLIQPLQQLLIDCGNDGCYISGSLILSLISSSSSWRDSVNDIDIFIKGTSSSIAAVGRFLIALQFINQLRVQRISYQSSLLDGPPPPIDQQPAPQSPPMNELKHRDSDKSGDMASQAHATKRARVGDTKHNGNDGDDHDPSVDDDTIGPPPPARVYKTRCICGELVIGAAPFWCHDPSHYRADQLRQHHHVSDLDHINSMRASYWRPPTDDDDGTMNYDRLHYVTAVLFAPQLKRHAIAARYQLTTSYEQHKSQQRYVAAATPSVPAAPTTAAVIPPPAAVAVGDYDIAYGGYDGGYGGFVDATYQPLDDGTRNTDNHALPTVGTLPPFGEVMTDYNEERLDIDVSDYLKHIRSCYYHIELVRPNITGAINDNDGTKVAKEKKKGFNIDIILIASDDCKISGGLWPWIARNFDLTICANVLGLNGIRCLSPLDIALHRSYMRLDSYCCGLGRYQSDAFHASYIDHDPVTPYGRHMLRQWSSYYGFRYHTGIKCRCRRTLPWRTTKYESRGYKLYGWGNWTDWIVNHDPEHARYIKQSRVEQMKYDEDAAIATEMAACLRNDAYEAKLAEIRKRQSSTNEYEYYYGSRYHTAIIDDIVYAGDLLADHERFITDAYTHVSSSSPSS